MRAWSPSLDEDLNPVTGVEWVGLVCASGTNEMCVLGVPSWDTLVRESPFP